MFQKRIDEVRNDFINGSSVIARNSLKILSDAVQYYDFSQKYSVLIIAQELLTAKPQMAAQINIMKIFMNEFPKFSNYHDITMLINKLESDMKIATEKSKSLCLETLFDEDKLSVITCSFSSNVFDILSKSGKITSIFILDSIWKNIDFGKMWLEKLSEFNVKCNIITLENNMPKINFAFIGADAVKQNGDIINGYPSMLLVQKMKENACPVYVISESFKYSDDLTLTDGFDCIPGNLISGIFSDKIFSTG